MREQQFSPSSERHRPRRTNRTELLGLATQPLVALAIYEVGAILAIFSLPGFDTLGMLWILTLTFGIWAVAYLVVLPSLPSPPNGVALSRRGIEDRLWRNDAKFVPPTLTTALTLYVAASVAPAELTTGGVSVGFRGIGVVLLGVGMAQFWLLYRLTAQYLPDVSPHLFDDEHVRPLDERDG